ncbi:hypothetical protein B0H10DRAFT_2069353 [Mycena sp. CBHHK59/15]|nr:hypothetical protein B0H10DRAFT_2069353 [Mycena sp. CBHHK59/15]
MQERALRATWHERWSAEHLDFVLTHASVMSAGPTFLFNMVSFPCSSCFAAGDGADVYLRAAGRHRERDER